MEVVQASVPSPGVSTAAAAEWEFIAVEGVTKRYRSRQGTVEAISEVSLSVARGEFVAIVGPSGCGKSTLLRMIAGLEPVSGGSIRVAGRKVCRPGADRGMVFQSYTLFPWLTVADNIAFGPRMRRVPEVERKRIVEHYLRVIGLERFARSYPKELSGGMKQRVAIARALANSPSVLLMDEPFGALDAQTKAQMQEFLHRLWLEERPTVLFVTHDIEEALYMAQRIYVLHAHPGRVAAEVTVSLPLARAQEVKEREPFLRLKRRITRLLEGAEDVA
ncbi:MAG: ABC transporter ATP-binding protein [Clostridia bacterium]|nr:ABC transporter ATP-binding protein [Clostridia bacterium]